MTIELLDASARLAEPLHPKILIIGPTAIGKTSLLKTLSAELLSTTLLVDLEAGDLPVADLEVASIRPRTWTDLRDLACAIGGPDPARASGAPYSQDHYNQAIADSTLASLARYSIIFVDSYTELSRRCRAWAEQQPESFNAYGKKDLRGAYGLVGRELIGWTQQLQHARARTIVLIAILEKIVDDHGVPTWQIQLEGQRARRELPAILDVIAAMVWVPFKDKPRRAFVCQSDTYPVKDRSGRLAPIEEPSLEKTTQQTFNPRRLKTIPIDLSKTSTPFDPGALIPSGTTAPMQISVKAGGHGDGGLLTAAETNKGRSAYLHLEFVVTAGPHKGRKFWKRSTVEGDDHAAAAAITFDLLGSLARSAYNFSMTDTGAEVDAKLKSFDYGDLNKLRVIGKIGVERGGVNQTTGEKYQDRNTVVAGVTKDQKEWAQWGAVTQDLDDGLTGAMPSPSAPPVSPIDPPPWAN